MNKIASLSLALIVLMSQSVAATSAQSEPLLSSVRIKMSYKLSRTETGTSWGSGVVVDLSEYGYASDSYVITAAHVVDSTNKAFPRLKVEVWNDEKKRREWVDAEVVQKDLKKDIAILKIDYKATHIAKLATVDKSEIGDQIFTIGCPNGAEVSVSDGKMEKKDDSNCKQLGSMNITHGNSGGPVFNSDGMIIGIVYAGIDDGENMGVMIQNAALFVSLNCIKAFLKEVEIKASSK